MNMAFLTAPGFTNNGITGGTEDASGNLNFTGLSIFLAPGTYWIDGWVNRPELTGGQWFWDMTNVGNPIGSEFYIQNPGGKLLMDFSGNPLAATPTREVRSSGRSPRIWLSPFSARRSFLSRRVLHSWRSAPSAWLVPC